MQIKIEDWHNLHNGIALTLKPGFTAFVGPNGAGKTTLLLQVEEYAKKEKIAVWKYSNLINGGNGARQQYLEQGEMDYLMASAIGSEGEQVAMNFSRMVRDLGNTVRSAVLKHQPLIVLLDAIDSGASIDRARELRDLFDLIEKDTLNNAEIYILMAVNHYELAKTPTDCVNARTGQHISFNSYDEYADFICSFEEKYPRITSRKNLRVKRRKNG